MSSPPGERPGPPSSSNQTLSLADLIPAPSGISACGPVHQCMPPLGNINACPSAHASDKCMASMRPRRKRRSDGLEVVSFNGSCWPSARDFLERTTAHVVCIQETKVDGDTKAAAERWCIKHHWKPFISSCHRTQAGATSAGVGVLVRSHIGAVPLHGPGGPQPEEGTIVKGWAIAVQVECGMRGGITVGSVYLECGIGIGINSRSWQRILKISEFFNFFCTPFCLGGGL